MEQIKEQHPHTGDWLREIVFGLNDGLVTTLVFLMAVSGTASSNLLLILLGEVMAGGVSMALGGYLSARTEQEVLQQRIATERYEIEHEPEEERAELRAIYQRKGIKGPLLDRIVNYLTADEERWHQALVHDELGVVDDTKIHPWWQGLQVGISFVIGGLIPTLPVLFSLSQPRWWAYGLTAVTAMGLGAIKARYTQKVRYVLASNFWWWSPLGRWREWDWDSSCITGEAENRACQWLDGEAGIGVTCTRRDRGRSLHPVIRSV